MISKGRQKDYEFFLFPIKVEKKKKNIFFFLQENFRNYI